MAATESRPCPACGSAESRNTREVSGSGMQSCRHCGTVFTARLPSSTEYKDYEGYYHEENLKVPAFLHRSFR